MKLLVLVCVSLLFVSSKVNGVAEECSEEKCIITNNCRCSSTSGPLALEKTPQLVVLAFTDAAKEDLYRDRWSPLVEPRINPDGEYIGATFYVQHEYSDYQIVHDLAVNGFEIGVHSVTNDAHQAYWREATQELLESEFGDQKKIISKFANIPETLITGTCTPQLQLAGDNSINAFVAKGFSYDGSWSSDSKLYPYTLDYLSTQTCDTEANCPKQSHKGFWMAPIVDLHNDIGTLCQTLAGCFGDRNNQTTREISDWLVSQVYKIKDTNRAPLTLIIEETLFLSVENSYNGLVNALDKLQEDKDIFFVSQARVIEWMKTPVAISEFKTGSQSADTSCQKETCKLDKDDGQVRYMVSCVPCPKVYPWLNNPEGN